MHVGDKDQMEAAIRDMATTIATYKKHLQAHNFSPFEIMGLLVAFQKSLISPPKGRG